MADKAKETVTFKDTVGEGRSKIDGGGCDVLENTTTLADAGRNTADRAASFR